MNIYSQQLEVAVNPLYRYNYIQMLEACIICTDFTMQGKKLVVKRYIYIYIFYKRIYLSYAYHLISVDVCKILLHMPKFGCVCVCVMYQVQFSKQAEVYPLKRWLSRAHCHIWK